MSGQERKEVESIQHACANRREDEEGRVSASSFSLTHPDPASKDKARRDPSHIMPKPTEREYTSAVQQPSGGLRAHSSLVPTPPAPAGSARQHPLRP